MRDGRCAIGQWSGILDQQCGSGGAALSHDRSERVCYLGIALGVLGWRVLVAGHSRKGTETVIHDISMFVRG